MGSSEPGAEARAGELERLLAAVDRATARGGAAFERFRKEVLTDLDRRLAQISQSVDDDVDPFGMDLRELRRTAIGAAFLYKVYFRCAVEGIEHVPAGPVIVVANHAGQLPIDGVMITSAMLLEADPPRLPRSMMDRWVPTLPFVSTFFSRVGVVLGTPANAKRLLERGEALLTFPEGMSGITKTIDRAYQLQPFGQGFMRLALSCSAPILPVAVVGSEEQYPTLYNLEALGHWLGLPALPIWPQMIIPVLGLLPLPVKYRLRFGEPMRFDGDPDDEDAVIGDLVAQVRGRIEELLVEVRAARRSVFW